MWYPLGKPAAGAMFYELRGGYGANKTCKERDHPGSQGWRSGTCASLGEAPCPLLPGTTALGLVPSSSMSPGSLSPSLHLSSALPEGHTVSRAARWMLRGWRGTLPPLELRGGAELGWGRDLDC